MVVLPECYLQSIEHISISQVLTLNLHQKLSKNLLMVVMQD